MEEREILKKSLRVMLICLATLAVFTLGRICPFEGESEPLKPKVDTLFVRDTIVFYKPQIVERVKLEKVLLPADTVMLHDTMFVLLQKEQVVWQDSLAAVYASGILPQIDSVKHFRSERIITIEKPIPVKVRDKWGLGLHAGVGACKDGLTPYIGVGVSYNILSW